MDFYLARLDEGWTMSEIDKTDFFYWIDLVAYSLAKEKHEEVCTIDQVF